MDEVRESQIVTGISISPSLLAASKAAVKVEHRSFSAQVSLLLQNWLSEREHGHPQNRQRDAQRQRKSP